MPKPRTEHEEVEALKLQVQKHTDRADYRGGLRVAGKALKRWPKNFSVRSVTAGARHAQAKGAGITRSASARR